MLDPRMVKPPEGAGPSSSALRLHLKPGVPTTSYVDGGWWPRSSVLPAELPQLLLSLAPILGRVALVGYHLNAWDPAPGHINIGENTVLLQGFTADDPHSVVVVSDSGQRLTLLVVAPESSERVAQQALSDSAESGDERNVKDERATDRSLDEVALRLSLLDGIPDDADRATIRRWVSEAAQQFVDAPIQSYVPILVEHIVRARIANAALAA